MLKSRLIPCLLLKEGGLVKSLRFRDTRYIGDPINAIRIFNEKEVDELIVLDIEASRKRRSPDFELIERIAGECFMPLTYGGGIFTIEQAHSIFSLGVEKICLQTSVLKDLSFVNRLADRFGSQSIVVSIDVKRSFFGRTLLYSSCNKRNLKADWVAHMVSLVKAGAGEVVLNSVDRDGTMMGMDIDIISEASNSISVPLVAIGGVGCLDHIVEAVNAGASAVAAGSFFVFHGPHKAVLITYPSASVLDELFSTSIAVGQKKSEGDF